MSQIQIIIIYMSINVSQSKIAGQHLRVYPLALKRPQSSETQNKTYKHLRRYSQNDPVPEFITEFLDEKPPTRAPAKSKIKHYSGKATNSEKVSRQTINYHLRNSSCFEIPKISYSDFKTKPFSEYTGEKLFIENTFYASPRSKFTLHARAYINPTITPRFKQIYVKPYRRTTRKKSSISNNPLNSLNEKIKRMFDLVRDPALSI